MGEWILVGDGFGGVGRRAAVVGDGAEMGGLERVEVRRDPSCTAKPTGRGRSATVCLESSRMLLDR